MKYALEKSIDSTQKIIFKEGYVSVIIPSKDEKYAVCLSCMIGCPMDCKFCRAGKFKRNLTSKEMMLQFNTAKKIIEKSPSSVVFMGMGEPMLNFAQVYKTGELIHKETNLPYKKITISTSGVHLNKLIDVPFSVALSLHSPFDEIRKKIMPNACSVKELVDFANEHCKKSKNEIMIEYSMIKGVNDRDEDLDELLSLNWPKGTKTLFNLIQFNDYRDFKQSSIERIREFKQAIINKGFKCFIRQSRGKDIDAACGMLDYK